MKREKVRSESKIADISKRFLTFFEFSNGVLTEGSYVLAIDALINLEENFFLSKGERLEKVRNARKTGFVFSAGRGEPFPPSPTHSGCGERCLLVGNISPSSVFFV